MVVHHMVTFPCPLFCIYLLLLFLSTCDASSQCPLPRPHLFKVGWPPAISRASFTCVLQGNAPFTETPPPLEWLLLSWLPGSYSKEAGAVPPTTTTTTEQQSLGAAFLRRHLPLGQWLAEAGITPHDRRPYNRLLVEMALAARLGGAISAEGRHFRLYCVLYKTEKEPHIVQTNQANVTQELNNKAYMLYSVVVCVDPSWPGLEKGGGASEAPSFVPCPPGEAGQTAAAEGVEVPCQGSYLYYFRTHDGGIDRQEPGLGEREEKEEEEEEEEEEEPLRIHPAHKQPHIFGTVWPPAYARLFTGINAYRARRRNRREEWLPFVRENLLNGGQPHLLPWMLHLWLPANYDAGPGRFAADVMANNRFYPLAAIELLAMDWEHLFGEHGWMEVAANRVQCQFTGQTLRLLRPEKMLRAWRAVRNFRCDQFADRPEEYFGLGAVFLRLHLPVGWWLEEAGITPNDTAPYHRKVIETALAARLGGGTTHAGGRHFILYCADMNVAEGRYTPPGATDYFNPNHPRPNMLLSVVVCVDRASWKAAGADSKGAQQQQWQWQQPGQPPEEIRFAPCPSEAPFYRGDELYKVCRRDWLYYYRTLNDGIDGPFLEELPVEQGGTGGAWQ